MPQIRDRSQRHGSAGEVATEWWTVEVAADATTDQLHLRPDYTAGLVAC